MDSDYTKRELELLFKRLEEKLDGIREDIASTTNHLEGRITTLERDVSNLKEMATKALTIWAIAVTALGFLLNKFL